MKKIFNIIGYISLIVLPYLLAIFIFNFFDLTKILCLMVLMIIIAFQIIHYKRTKIKDYGIRILITIITISIFSFLIHSGYGIIKNKQVVKLTKTIEKIEFNGYELNREELENNLKFVNTKSIMTKGTYDAIIYYTDGIIEKTEVYKPPFYIIKIKNDKYYINMF